MKQSAAQQKSQIRAQIRQMRRQINPAASLIAGQQICERLTNHPDYPASRKIACFISFDGEIDTRPIIDRLIADKGVCYLPKIRPGKPNRLWFMPFNGHQGLTKNRLGIPEVNLSVNHAVRVSKLDMLLLPLVAFDSAGNRLGMGGGFYDATLSHLKARRAKSERPLFLGLAFAQQRVQQLPVSSWDLPLDGIFCENEFVSCQKQANE